MDELEHVLGQIANNLDQRRLEITSIRRVTLNYVGMALESRAVVMAIPMLYAHWEGYFKDTLKKSVSSISSILKPPSNVVEIYNPCSLVTYGLQYYSP